MNNNKKVITAVSVTVIVTAVLTFLTTSYFFTTSQTPRLGTILSILDKYFYKEIDMETLDNSAARAAVFSLNDPYTEYMSPEEWREFKNHLDSVYCGIGIYVTKSNLEDYLTVLSAIDNSPAKEAGLTTGDIIISVNGEPTNGLAVDDIVSKIKGIENTTVNLTVLKADTNEEINIDVLRKELELITVTSELLDGNIGYLTFTSFNDNSGVKFEEHFNKLISDGASSIILDLRDNGGGITDEAEYIANLLLPKNTVIYSTKNRAGKTRVIKTKKDGNTEIPIVVLVNSNTASASEILSSCIQENGRGVLVGTKTFGKGLVQTIFNFPEGSALKVTIEQYFTSKGNDINDLGIEPDHVVELLSESDEQLEFAKSLLNK